MTDERRPRRRWFQFGVRTLLLFPVVFAVTWWWVTWPSRTSRKFLQSITEGHYEMATQMMSSKTGERAGIGMAPSVFAHWWTWSRAEKPRRSLADFVVGRRRFVCSEVVGEFVAQHGRITFRAPNPNREMIIEFKPVLSEPGNVASGNSR